MKYKYKIIKKGEEERKVRKVKNKTQTHTQLHSKHTNKTQQQKWMKDILIHIATIINARKVKLMLVVTFRKFKVIGQS